MSTTQVGIEHFEKAHGFGGFWTSPGETERQAFLSAQAMDWRGNRSYIGFPWFSLIHALETNNSALSSQLFVMFNELLQQLPTNVNAITVSQHPKTLLYIEYFQQAGISQLLFPHKPKELSELAEIQLLPFPLMPLNSSIFAAPTPELERKFLANFIGTEGWGEFHSETRKYIFTLKERADVRIIERPGWYYEQVIERELGLCCQPRDDQLIEEFEFAKQFRHTMRDSHFALCPGGRGLCTARIYEALGCGAIPVILTTSLSLPGDQSLWRSAVVFTEDSREGVDAAMAHIQALSGEQITEMQRSGRELYRSLSPCNYGHLIQNLTKGT